MNYIYKGVLDMSGEELGSVLLAANMFQMEDLQNLCINLIKEDM